MTLSYKSALYVPLKFSIFLKLSQFYENRKIRNPNKEPAPTVAQSDHAGPRPASPKSTDTVQSSDSTGDKQSGLVRIKNTPNSD